MAGGRSGRDGVIPALTGLRGVGAVWVVSLHLTLGSSIPIVSRGDLGVDLFFILSGFILTRVHMSDFDGGYSIAKFGRFLLLRLARIYPLHLFTLFVFGAIVLALPDFTDRYEHPEYFSWQQFIATALLVQNWRMGLVSAWNSPSWSLSAEWLAYIAFPVSIFLASVPRWEFKPVVAMAALLAMMFLCTAAGNPAISVAGAVGLIRMAAEFFAGCLIGQFVMDSRSASLPWSTISGSQHSSDYCWCPVPAGRVALHLRICGVDCSGRRRRRRCGTRTEHRPDPVSR